MEYHIQLEQFEGPLSLLLALIEQEKLDITKVSLAKVTDQYLEYVSQEDHISLENLAKFLSIAARLILIKSKALLPILDFTEEEEEEIGDLEEELRRYKRFKEAAEQLGKTILSKKKSESRESSLETISVFLPPKNLTGESLALYFRSVLGTLVLSTPLKETRLTEIITLEEKIALLQDSIRDRVTRSFSHIVANAENHVHIIVSFLALLELIKQKVIHAHQEERFGEIHFGSLEGDSTSFPPIKTPSVS